MKNLEEGRELDVGMAVLNTRNVAFLRANSLSKLLLSESGFASFFPEAHTKDESVTIGLKFHP